MSTLWKPYVSGAQADAARATAAALGELLAQPVIEEEEASLSRGSAGRALALAHLGLREASHAALRQAIGDVAAQPLGPGLMQGFTGVAWVVAHLGAGEATASIDDVLIRVLEQGAWRGGYDHVSGLVGVGVYALERLPAPAGARLLELVVAALRDSAERESGTATWFTPPTELFGEARERAPHGYYNFGVAHGVAGSIAMLAGAVNAGVAEAGRLLDEAVAWLDAQTLDDAPALWPFFTGRGIEVMPGRLAWCYGDPGIALALLHAAAARGRDDWCALADRAL